jgi:hypothetical protein
MRILCITVSMVGVLLGGMPSAWAQLGDGQNIAPLPAQAIPLAEHAIEAPTLSPDPAGEAELEQWIDAFSDWKRWRDQWGNRREPGWFSGFRNRKVRPDPPVWLADKCEDSVEDSDVVVTGCTLLAEWRADLATAQAATARTTATTAQEDSNKTIWWEHVHLDVAWPAMQSGMSYLGVVGVHATTSVRGRLQIFIAPGAMLLNVPTRYGARAWKLASNYGVAFRLGQFKFPGNKQALLHVNLAKAWLLNAGPDVPTKSADFVGFSVTFKKTP